MEEIKNLWGWFMVLGICLIVFGVLAISVPLIPGLAVVFLIGCLFILSGISHLIHMFQCKGKGWGGVISQLLSGLLYLVAGIIFIARPGAGLAGLTLLLAFIIMMAGITIANLMVF